MVEERKWYQELESPFREYMEEASKKPEVQSIREVNFLGMKNPWIALYETGSTVEVVVYDRDRPQVRLTYGDLLNDRRDLHSQGRILQILPGADDIEISQAFIHV